ncbi:Regulator of nucleoside diphosphate kinase [compost metagenome]|jgi:regulator of nucleoside diphosphate kinase
MKYNKIIIEEKDFNLLKTIISKSQRYKGKNYYSSIKKLRKELEYAQILSSDAIPDDIIRVNSTVTIQMSSNVVRSFQIVTPGTGNVIHDKLSILSPIGLAVIGYAVNDEILWQFASGLNKLKILKVMQN